jgi:hypothetical protein
MPLVRLTKADGTWGQVYSDWGQQCVEFGESIDDYATPTIDHALKIAGESQNDPKYGIYAFEENGQNHAILHLNQARLPSTSGTTLRAVWILLSPRYDFAEIDPLDLANIAAGIITGVVELARSPDVVCQHMKVHIGNAFDRRVFTTATHILARAGVGVLQVRGNWLHGDGLGAPHQAVTPLRLHGG